MGTLLHFVCIVLQLLYTFTIILMQLFTMNEHLARIALCIVLFNLRLQFSVKHMIVHLLYFHVFSHLGLFLLSNQKSYQEISSLPPQVKLATSLSCDLCYATVLCISHQLSRAGGSLNHLAPVLEFTQFNQKNRTLYQPFLLGSWSVDNWSEIHNVLPVSCPVQNLILVLFTSVLFKPNHSPL